MEGMSPTSASPRASLSAQTEGRSRETETPGGGSWRAVSTARWRAWAQQLSYGLVRQSKNGQDLFVRQEERLFFHHVAIAASPGFFVGNVRSAAPLSGMSAANVCRSRVLLGHFHHG